MYVNQLIEGYCFYYPVSCLCGSWRKEEALSIGKSGGCGEK